MIGEKKDFEICFLFHVWKKEGAESEKKMLILRKNRRKRSKWNLIPIPTSPYHDFEPHYKKKNKMLVGNILHILLN